MSQHELDREARITKGTTHDLESGRIQKPSHETVTRIIWALRRKGLVGATAEEIFPVTQHSPLAS